MNLSLLAKSNLIKEKAHELGLDLCGIVKADFLDDEKENFLSWIQKGYHGEMGYMANNIEKRLDPRLLVENTKSIVVVGLNYFPKQQQSDPEAPVIAKYAYGKDYHFVLKDRLNKLFEYINTEIQEVSGRAFVDSAPILEHAWAKKAGLGWIGKNSLLINRKIGSFLFLGELFLDIELEYENPTYADFCGGCNRCIRSCPTGAITEPYVVNGSKCISYYTIELKGEIPEEGKGKFQNRVFGCDICQDVCPWNRMSKAHQVPEFEPNPDLLSMSKEDWQQMDAHKFGEIFRNSAVKRTKFKGIKRNLDFLDL
ncbi:tRNA epoxyqueuosine(34) reductase QueG [Marinifilum caeruleilacunae]|uniref:Epoxyqueuosine reductase n=1 Tax=Marinifilum caeruleilacunae TaxID=2499076 RepID=A0ABX1X003_9BACT|nr:tRNA epoxyqueuosine(34) reductase QueG [Marinifilum caeruleilacunae]NOU61592.1 tRNA epoxyqueuosine(34) reductase QueG [Marinifilum caeruleilacunae]